jgi:5-methylcytosine-specific restriction endonuclease McrA
MGPLGACELCSRKSVDLTRHHLIPRTRHSNKKSRQLYSREKAATRLAMLCRACHQYVHTLLTEKELERGFNTIDRLREHPEIRKFVDWVRNKPAGLRVRSHRG